MADVYASGEDERRARDLWARRDDHSVSLDAQRERLLAELGRSSIEYTGELEWLTRKHLSRLRELYGDFRASLHAFHATDNPPQTTEAQLILHYIIERDRELERYAAEAAQLRRFHPDRRQQEEVQALHFNEIVSFIVEVSRYLGSAAAGGVIGSRADAAMSAAATRIFKRLTARKSGTALSSAEAIEAAQAAAISEGLSPHADLADARQDADGTWRVLLVGTNPLSFLKVRIPNGDLATARIVIVVEPPSF